MRSTAQFKLCVENAIKWKKFELVGELEPIPGRGQSSMHSLHNSSWKHFLEVSKPRTGKSVWSMINAPCIKSCINYILKAWSSKLVKNDIGLMENTTFICSKSVM